MHLSIIVCVAIFACANARVMNYTPEQLKKNPNLKWSKIARHTRDVTWDKQVGDGKVFGTLGNNDQGLFGKGGYKQEIFNDNRGKLEGQAYGNRVLGAGGDSSHLGGRLDWSNNDAKAALDISKQIGGRTSVSATGAGVWNLDKNTNLSAGGSVNHSGRGKPDVAVQAELTHNF